MINKLKRFLCFVLCFCFSFCLAGCMLITEGDGENGEVPSAESYISGATLVTKGNGNDTYSEVLNLVNSLSNTILDGLYSHYGAQSNSALFRNSVEDTHKNAMWQDNWLWCNKEDFSSMDWSSEGLNKADFYLILKYNILKILLNEDVEDFKVFDLNNNDKYYVMKSSGAFDDTNFINMAKNVTHTGIFYYELDTIAEYVLYNIIGENALNLDNKKFVDANNNKTFDFNENVNSSNGSVVDEYNYSIILSYTMDKKRSNATSRSIVWDKIEFGNPISNVNAPNAEIVREKAIPIDYLKINNIANSYVKQGTTYYSGFKNYVNTVFYIIYSSIPNLWEMEHKANANFEEVETKYISIATEENVEVNNGVKFDNYHSVVIKAKKDFSLASIWLCLELDKSITETVEFSIDGTYYHCVDTVKHAHNADCVFEKVNGNFGNIVVSPNKEGEFYADLGLTEEDLQDLKDKNVNTDDLFITDFTKKGIKSFDLTQYVEPQKEEGENVENTENNKPKQLMAFESGSLVGCDFMLNETLNDYLEIKFNVVSKHKYPIKFKFAFFW